MFDVSSEEMTEGSLLRKCKEEASCFNGGGYQTYSTHTGMLHCAAETAAADAD